jgi:hypothetical protein
MAIPTDEASCIAWHEAFHEPEADSSAPAHLSGINGLPYGPLAPGSGVTLQTLAAGAYAGRRVYRVTGGSQISTAAILTARPFTIVVAYAGKDNTGDRRTINGGPPGQVGDWFIGGRASGLYTFFPGSGIATTARDTDVVHVHSIRQRSAGTLADYRIDGVSQGTGGGGSIPGRVRFGTGSSEPPNADIVGISIFSTDLSDANLAAQEAYWATGGSGSLTVTPSRLTQLAVEAIRDGTPNIRLSQHVFEVVNGANPNVLLSQFIIEVVLKRGGKRFRVQVIG